MNFAILAAGRGERLSEINGKPMAQINGKPMITRLLDILRPLVDVDNEIRAVISPANPLVAAELCSWQQSASGIRLNVIQSRTVSPVESLGRVLEGFGGEEIVVTTVDTVFSAKALRLFASRWLSQFSCLDALMGVTRTIDDEKPLYVAVSDDNPLMVTAFCDEACSQYVSAGVYALSRAAIDVAADCHRRGITRLRGFQRALLDAGLRVGAFDLGATIDVDRPSDLVTAAKIDFNPS